MTGAPRPATATPVRSRRRELGRRLRSAQGNALVEFVVLGVALLVPCAYLVLSLGSVQSAAFAADVLARDAARIHAMERDAVRADQRTELHARLLLEDHRLTGAHDVRITCSMTPCSAPGGVVTARVRLDVPVPGLGPVLGRGGPFAVGAEHAIEVGEHRGANR